MSESVVLEDEGGIDRGGADYPTDVGLGFGL